MRPSNRAQGVENTPAAKAFTKGPAAMTRSAISRRGL